MAAERWTRPASVPVPTVWRRFEGRKPGPDGKTIRFKIQDPTPEMFDDIIEHMCTYFLRDEHLAICTRLLEDEQSVKELQGVWREHLEQNMALVAFVDENDEDSTQGKPTIAGANITGLMYKDKKGFEDKFQGKAVRQLMRLVFDHVDSKIDVFAMYGVDVYLGALGLSVNPEFRGQGLGLELLKARFDLGKAVNLDVTVTAFTGIASQVLAHKLNFNILTEIVYSEYKDNGEAVFDNNTTKTLKVMGKKIRDEK